LAKNLSLVFTYNKWLLGRTECATIKNQSHSAK